MPAPVPCPGVATNFTDTISGSDAKGRFASVERRARTADANVADLVQELVETSNDLVSAVQMLYTNDTEAMAAQLEGDGTKDKATGLPWNPIQKPERPISDAGGDYIRVVFPTDRLVADDRVKMYQCKFTLIKDGKLDTDDTRISEKFHAETERTFGCITPVWSQPGKLPEETKWQTVMSVYENGREMPSPKDVTVLDWVPATPGLTIQEAFEAKAPKNKAKKFTVPFKIDYPYGEAGYKEVDIEADSDDDVLSRIRVLAADAKTADRALEFTINDDSGKKEMEYSITVTVTSQATKLKTELTLTINFVAQAYFAEGGTEDVVNEVAMAKIFGKIGRGNSETWKLCYSRTLHGWSNTEFNNRCRQKGPLFLLQRRGSNKRVYGGYSHREWRSCCHGYHYGSSQSTWLFRIDPNNPNNVEYTTKHWHSYQTYDGNRDYLMCFGGGHDLCSRGTDGHQWANLGHDYKPPIGGGYGSSSWRNWFYGTYSYNAKNEGDVYEVYMARN